MVEVKKINENMWEIPKTGEMNVPGLVLASEKLIKDIKQDKTLSQVQNVAKLPGIIGSSIALMDAHQGYGFSIGGVAGFDMDKGVISPGGVGYDIDCSVRLLSTNLTLADIEKVGKKEIIHSLFRTVPSGVGRGSKINLKASDLNEVLRKGARWAVEHGYGSEEDLAHLEENGNLTPADPENVSKRAKQRGIGQLGTLGAGNHFLEIQEVTKIYDKEKAKEWGLEKGQITIMIHCGSRGLGHQVASDYIKLMEAKYGWPEYDRELVNAPIKSELGEKYFSAMNCAANFAFANKQVITHWVRENLLHYFPKLKADVVYEVCHNIAKKEKHDINGEEKEILVMRKGATRAFPNQPVLIPGSMGTASYVLVGTQKAVELSFGSTAHGAGRVKSRTKARKTITTDDVKKEMASKGIELEAGSFKGIVEEASSVYKDIDEVVKVSDELGIGKLIAKLKPLAVMKG
ncbi:RtcB family protein [Candidatus Pacearchaeota archaeon]|nr:RtcB family protein [Candidatus Pacearchaeota archaeon]